MMESLESWKARKPGKPGRPESLESQKARKPESWKAWQALWKQKEFGGKPEKPGKLSVASHIYYWKISFLHFESSLTFSSAHTNTQTHTHTHIFVIQSFFYPRFL